MNDDLTTEQMASIEARLRRDLDEIAATMQNPSPLTAPRRPDARHPVNGTAPVIDDDDVDPVHAPATAVQDTSSPIRWVLTAAAAVVVAVVGLVTILNLDDGDDGQIDIRDEPNRTPETTAPPQPPTSVPPPAVETTPMPLRQLYAVNAFELVTCATADPSFEVEFMLDTGETVVVEALTAQAFAPSTQGPPINMTCTDVTAADGKPAVLFEGVLGAPPAERYDEIWFRTPFPFNDNENFPDVGIMAGFVDVPRADVEAGFSLIWGRERLNWNADFDDLLQPAGASQPPATEETTRLSIRALYTHEPREQFTCNTANPSFEVEIAYWGDESMLHLGETIVVEALTAQAFDPSIEAPPVNTICTEATSLEGKPGVLFETVLDVPVPVGGRFESIRIDDPFGEVNRFSIGGVQSAAAEAGIAFRSDNQDQQGNNWFPGQTDPRQIPLDDSFGPVPDPQAE